MNKISAQIIYLIIMGLLILVELFLVIPTFSGLFAENGVIVNVIMTAVYFIMYILGKSVVSIERPKNIVMLIGMVISPIAITPILGNILHLAMAIFLVVVVRKAYLVEVDLAEYYAQNKKEVEDGKDEQPSIFDDFYREYDKVEVDKYEIDEDLKDR